MLSVLVVSYSDSEQIPFFPFDLQLFPFSCSLSPAASRGRQTPTHHWDKQNETRKRTRKWWKNIQNSHKIRIKLGTSCQVDSYL